MVSNLLGRGWPSTSDPHLSTVQVLGLQACTTILYNPSVALSVSISEEKPRVVMSACNPIPSEAET